MTFPLDSLSYLGMRSIAANARVNDVRTPESTDSITAAVQSMASGQVPCSGIKCSVCMTASASKTSSRSRTSTSEPLAGEGVFGATCQTGIDCTVSQSVGGSNLE